MTVDDFQAGVLRGHTASAGISWNACSWDMPPGNLAMSSGSRVLGGGQVWATYRALLAWLSANSHGRHEV